MEKEKEILKNEEEINDETKENLKEFDVKDLDLKDLEWGESDSENEDDDPDGFNLLLENQYKAYRLYFNEHIEKYEGAKLNNEEYFLSAVIGDMLSHAMSLFIDYVGDYDELELGSACNLKAVMEDLISYKLYESGSLSNELYLNFALNRYLPSYREKNRENLMKNWSDEDFDIASNINAQIKQANNGEEFMKLKSMVPFAYAGGSAIDLDDMILHFFDQDFLNLYKLTNILAHPHYIEGKYYPYYISTLSANALSILFEGRIEVLRNAEPDFDSIPGLKDTLKNSDAIANTMDLVAILGGILIGFVNSKRYENEYEETLFMNLILLYSNIRKGHDMGYYDQTLVKFSLFMNYVATYEKIFSFEKQEREHIIEGLFINSTSFSKVMDMDETIKNLGRVHSRRARDVYNMYYKHKYDASYDEFKEKIENLDLYFLSDNEELTYDDLVYEFAENYYDNPADIEDLKNLFDYASTFMRAGDYLYKPTVDDLKGTAAKCIKFMQDYFIHFIDKKRNPNDKEIEKKMKELASYFEEDEKAMEEEKLESQTDEFVES